VEDSCEHGNEPSGPSRTAQFYAVNDKKKKKNIINKAVILGTAHTRILTNTDGI
jgi:hypothetical protein